MILFISWIILAFVVASIGGKKTIGYWPTLILSLILSPLIGLIFALASSDLPKPIVEYQCKFCGFNPPLTVIFARHVIRIAPEKQRQIIRLNNFGSY